MTQSTGSILLCVLTAGACDTAAEPSLAFDDPNDLALSALGDPHACTGAPKPTAGAGLPLGSTNVRTPDPARTGASLLRTEFDADLVPLVAPSLTAPSPGAVRQTAPTQVRVVLDKVESLRPGLIAKGKVSRLGAPERVTLVAGDELQVITWNGNYTGQAVYVGIGVDGAELDDFLEGVSATAAKGGSAVSGTLSGAPVAGSAGFYGQKLGSGAIGGWVLRGKVRTPPPGQASWELSFTHLATFSTSATGVAEVEYAAAEAVYQGLNPTPKLHQQGQFYGRYEGSLTLSKGERAVIAAPGSYAYHGSDYQGLIDADEKQAAYWVPLQVAVSAGSPAPTKLRAVTSTGKYVDSSAVVIEVTGSSGKATTLPPGGSVAFQAPGTVTVTFLGTSATALALEAL